MENKIESLISNLSKLGFTNFESRAYLSLLTIGKSTGYELSKASGIPSSKIYGVLQHLVSKKLVDVLDSHPVRYFSRPPEEWIEEYAKAISDSFSFLKKNLNKIYLSGRQEEVIAKNLIGRKDIMRKAREFITNTKQSLYLALWNEECRPIHTTVKKAHARGVEIFIVAYGTIPIRVGKIFQHAPSDIFMRERGERRFVLVSDTDYALFANFSKEDSEKALWTANKGLVLLIKDFVIHEIYIVKIREKFPREITEAFGQNWEKIRLPHHSSLIGKI